MASKIEYYSNIAAETVDRIKSEWPTFLDTAARTYKYTFADQLMIYAQRPEATACASFELWNKMNRWIKGGSKGIALIDSSDNGTTKLRYVFDIADTIPGRGNTPDIKLWQMKPSNEAAVLRMFDEIYGEKAESVEKAIDIISNALAYEYVDNQLDEIKEDNPYITEYEFREFTAASISYIIRSRCGLEAKFPENFKLNNLTQDGIVNLGKAISSQSEKVLREIETAIKDHERGLENERGNNIQTGRERGLFDSRYRTPGAERSEQVRADAPEIHRGTQTPAAQQTFMQGDAERTSLRDRGDGGHESGAHDGGISEDRPAAGQGDGHDGVDRTHEHAESAGGRDSNGGTDLRITEPGAGTTVSAPETAHIDLDGIADGLNYWNRIEKKDGIALNPPGTPENYKTREGDRFRIDGVFYEVREITGENVTLRDITSNVSINESLRGSTSGQSRTETLHFLSKFQTLHMPQLGDQYLINGRTFEVYGISPATVKDNDGIIRLGDISDPDGDLINIPVMYTTRGYEARPETAQSPTMEAVPESLKFNNKEYNLEYRYSDDGITVYNRQAEAAGGRVAVARISTHRDVTFYEDLPEKETAEIQRQARVSELIVPGTVDMPVFTTPAERELYDPAPGDRYRINERVYEVGETSDTEITLRDAATGEKTNVSPAFLQDYSPLHIPKVGDLYDIEGKTYAVEGVSAKHVILDDIANPDPGRLTLDIGYLKNNGYEAIWDLPASIEESFDSEFINTAETAPDNALAQETPPTPEPEAEHATVTAPIQTEAAPEAEHTTVEKKYDLGYGTLGNGVTVWNRAEERDRDYVTVAHISPEREVTFYDKDLPENLKDSIRKQARTMELHISATQPYSVFTKPPEDALTYEKEPPSPATTVKSRQEQEIHEQENTKTYDPITGNRYRIDGKVWELRYINGDLRLHDVDVNARYIPVSDSAIRNHRPLHMPENIGDQYHILSQIYEVESFTAENVLIRQLGNPDREPFLMPVSHFRMNNYEAFANPEIVLAKAPAMEALSVNMRIPEPGDEYRIGKRLYEVEEINDNTVSMRDITFNRNSAVTIQRAEPVEFFKDLMPENKQIPDVELKHDHIKQPDEPATDMYIPKPGDEYRIGGRLFEVEEITSTNVSMRDITFARSSGFPIFRNEPIGFFKDLKPLNQQTPAQENDISPTSQTAELPEQPERPAAPTISAQPAERREMPSAQRSLFDAPLMAGPVIPAELNHPPSVVEKNDNIISAEKEQKPAKKFQSLEAIEAELDRKAELMREHKNYETICEAVRYLKLWRTDFYPSLDGISADVISKQICEASDEKAVELLSAVDWNDWRRHMGFVVFTDPKYDNLLAGEKNDYRITYMNLGIGGPKTKYDWNIDAIRTLKQVESENRYATQDEQKILSKYVGWGGLQQAFDENNPQWANEYAQLKELLTESEYESARTSTLNAHYTPPPVIQAMYETVERMGFKTGNILEPSCGAGNFLGMLPEKMKDSKLYGVELDGLTGRIAQKLYPNANIQIKGYEKVDMPDATFDLVIGNVPFGGYGVADKRYDRHNFKIHDYFFAKTLDKVRPGGIVAFITSQGTMDKQSPDTRRYLAQRAELLGAVRLPNNAFHKTAGTDVTTDIIFLQRRERQVDIDAEWIHRGMLENGIPVNSYFAAHPEQILGEMRRGNKMYGREDDNSTSCYPIENADLAADLHKALSRIEGRITEPSFDAAPEYSAKNTLPADPNVRNHSYAVINDTVYYRQDSLMVPSDKPVKTQERIKDMVALRDCARELIDYQLNNHSESVIAAKRRELNEIYDGFTKKHGLINDSANKHAFKDDNGYHLLSALEILNENGELERKSDIFTKRTVSAKQIITHVETSSEALAVSLAEKANVDLPYMSELTGFPEEKVISDLEGVIFQNPEKSQGWEAADEYLSGNVRHKLEVARTYAQQSPQFQINVDKLEEVQPMNIDASEISVKLGATWIKKSYIEQFVNETLKLPYHAKPLVNFSEHTGKWSVAALNSADKIMTGVTYGTNRADAFKIIEESLNLRDILIHDNLELADGKKVTLLNKDETAKAQQRQEALRQAFKDWVFNEPERRRELVKVYNEKFNSIRPREFNGSHMTFPGINPEIKFRKHQVNGVARILYGGNALLAHEVGAGKTYTMIAAAMEGKRLGICNKSLIAVPKHLTEQFGSDFLKLYPSANILVAKTTDFEPKNRKRFCAKIATGDYDAIIIGHTQLEKLPLSQERQEKLLKEQINDLTEGIRELKEAKGDRYTIKEMERIRQSIKEKLTSMLEGGKKDDVVTFEQLGCDRLFVDEAHGFKNLFLYTKMRNVAGISQSKADKTIDLFMKCRYMDEIAQGKGVIFSTGTPISNSMTETYTMQRYLQYDALEKQGLKHFDAWASTFGETVTSVELAPEGGGYRARTRFKYSNLPELVTMFKNVADIQTAEMMKLPRPELKYETVVAQPTPLQKDMIEELSQRAYLVHKKLVEPENDNMLLITNDGRKIGLDQRLINPLLADDPNSKVNLCANKVYDIWKNTEKDRLTQLIFCDLSTPGTGKNKKPFNIYDDLRTKLIDQGVPTKEIAFVHDATTEEKKEKLFSDVRAGRVRILIGSTPKMGSGTNVQDRLIHLHNLDCPWKPAELEQRNGRILRQGNRNPEVGITNYVTEGTFDSYLYQTIEHKQKFISQIMTSKSPVRNCDDMDETALSYAEIKALCIGDPRIKEKMDLDIEVSRLKAERTAYQNQKYQQQDAIMLHYPRAIAATEKKIAGYLDDQERIKTNTIPNKDGFSPMKIGYFTYTEKAEAGKALIDICTVAAREPREIGEYRGFKIDIAFDPAWKSFTATIKGAMHYPVTLGNDIHGNITRLNNALEKIPDLINSAEQQLESTKNAMEQAKEDVLKPFRHEELFQKQSAKLAELDRELSLDAEKPPTGAPEDTESMTDTDAHETDGQDFSELDDMLEMIAETPYTAQTAQFIDDEAEYDEPGTESNEPPPGEAFRQGLRDKLENDFGKLPSNIIIGGIGSLPKDNHNNTSSGMRR